MLTNMLFTPRPSEDYQSLFSQKIGRNVSRFNIIMLAINKANITENNIFLFTDGLNSSDDEDFEDFEDSFIY